MIARELGERFGSTSLRCASGTCLGGEWLALSHLYIAVETLTQVVIRKMTSARGISEKDLAKSLDVITDDPDRPRWRQILRERTRERIIFDGDGDTY